MILTLGFFSVGCKFKALIRWFQTAVNTVALLIVLLKPLKVMGYDLLTLNYVSNVVPNWCIIFQVTGIFRGGFTTLLRESIGNAVFFCTYEHLRYYIHAKLKDFSHDSSNLIDIGVGVVTGGLGGIAVSILIT